MTADLRIAAAVLAATTLFGCTTTQPPAPAASSAPTNDPTCLTDTGSRIPPGRGQCRGIGRSYSGQDIERTGAISAADALSLLDSSVHR